MENRAAYGSEEEQKGDSGHFCRDDFLVICLFLSCLAINFVYGLRFGGFDYQADPLFLLDIVYLSACFLVLIFLHQLWRHLPQGFHGLSLSWRYLRENYIQPGVLFRFASLYLLIPLFIVSYHNFKSTIPLLRPFAWDERLSKIDWFLHFGHHPWQLLRPLTESFQVLRVLDWYYANLWMTVLAVFLIWMAWYPHRRLRNRFFLSFLLAWILLGTLLALVFSSAGPCYFQQVVGVSNPFAPLMARLHETPAETPLVAVQIQDALWQAYQQKRFLLGTGISAMPSMHLAGATLCALTAWNIHRGLGLLLGMHGVIILVGSVALGWHYAVDGYFSIAASCLIWRYSGRLLERIHPSSPTGLSFPSSKNRPCGF